MFAKMTRAIQIPLTWSWEGLRRPLGIGAVTLGIILAVGAKNPFTLFYSEIGQEKVSPLNLSYVSTFNSDLMSDVDLGAYDKFDLEKNF